MNTIEIKFNCIHFNSFNYDGIRLYSVLYHGNAKKAWKISKLKFDRFETSIYKLKYIYKYIYIYIFNYVWLNTTAKTMRT